MSKNKFDKMCLLGHTNKSDTYRVEYYSTPSGKLPAREWLHSIKDKLTKAILYKRIRQAGEGQFGNHKYLGDGVFELKINFGPGYRIYYGTHKNKLIIILMGGNKSTQQKDIQKAKLYWINYEKK